LRSVTSMSASIFALCSITLLPYLDGTCPKATLKIETMIKNFFILEADTHAEFDLTGAGKVCWAHEVLIECIKTSSTDLWGICWD